MGLIFKNDLHDAFGTWPFGYTASGGADIGEVIAVAQTVGDGDDGAFYDAWMAAGDRLAAEAEAALARGHRESASASWLRASAFYATSSHPLFGAPVDPRLTRAFRAQIAAFDKGLALLPVPVAPLRIPFEGAELPAYLLPAAGRETERRPLVILTNGYDASVVEMYFACAVAASRRGYHCLFFDGPGQGDPLIEHGTRLRPDWETVIRPVVDFALGLPGIDPERIALSGWSLGGHLALRAASGEPRLAACVADPGLPAVIDKAALVKFGLSETQAADLATVDAGTWAAMRAAVDAKPMLHWTVVQRGFWVHGVDNLRDFFTAAEQFTLEGRLGAIRCPTLLTAAEHDALAAGSEAVLAGLACPKTLIRFTAAEGAGSHCEMFNRSLLNRRVFDWLDETLARPGALDARPGRE